MTIEVVGAARASGCRLRRPGVDRRRARSARADGWWSRPTVGAERRRRVRLRPRRRRHVRPDPRSRRQPDGVHEPSAWFDPDAHAWSDGALDGAPARRIA